MNTMFLPIAFACFKVGGCMFYAPYEPQFTREACMQEIVKVKREVHEAKGRLLSYSLDCLPVKKPR